MAIWYSDIAINQIQGNNLPGQVGVSQLPLTDGQPVQNIPILEGPDDLVATYFWTGAEAAGDIINLGILREGILVNPKVTVNSGPVAPATTLTVAIGDNDLGLLTNLPIPNPGAAASLLGTANSLQAPTWTTGTVYAAGNVVLDPTSTPANQTYTCILGLTSATAPHSDATHWIANSVRYSASMDIHAASGNVAGAGGTQLYGGVASHCPESILPGTVQTGYSAASLLFSQYIIQHDCWAQALILTAAGIVANTASVFRIPTNSLN
jgi:hypothetical protein